MRTKMPLVRAAQPKQLMATMHRWKFSALAAAAVVSVGLYAPDASALALGRITVQSALGEPLKAEVELPQVTEAEASSLKAQIATPDAFRAQGMEYSSAVNGLQVQLHRRADGSAVLRLSSNRPVNEPFVDLVLNASWDSGQIVRSYTMLFDPPSMRRAPAAVTAPAQTSASPAAPAVQSAPPEAPARQAARPTTSATQPATVSASPRPAPAAESNVTVRPGDTAGRLANAHRPSGVSLDQMLVAMMRSNPDAFIGGNMNRIKAGAVLQIPDETAAQSVSASEARQIVSAQSRDFNEFRRKLAGSVPATTIEAAGRAASGKVQTQVEDKRQATAAPDKLTLSKGAVKGQKTADDKLAQDKQADEQAARMAELSRNITDLNKISAASAPVGGATAAPTAPGVAVTAPGAIPPAATPPAPATTSAPAPVVVASAPQAEPAAAPAEPAATAAAATAAASEAATATPAPAPAPAPAPSKPAPPPAPVAEEPSFLDSLMEDPMIPMAGGGILLALLGFGAYRMLQRRRNAAAAGVDSTFMESKLQPDSFFGASGGQRVDTANSEMTTGSSLAYSPSQLDAGGDVDPVAEADVYLAYGRDLQAEEILKEAARHNPTRTSIQVKLAEIYAKRQDRKALEAVASEVFQQTQGSGADWARVMELGRELDTANPLYQPGGRPGMAANSAPVAASSFQSTNPAPLAAAAAAAAVAALPPELDLDLDLDLDLPSDALTEAPPAAPGSFAAAAATAVANTPRPLEMSDLASASSESPAPLLPPIDAPEPQAPHAVAAPTPELDLGALDMPDWNAPTPAAASSAPVAPPASSAAQQMPELDFPLDGLELLESGIAPLTPVASKAAAPAPEADMDFDLGDLSLDLGSPKVAAPPPAAPAATSSAAEEPSDPLSTKLALAEEFHAIGDSDGARTLIEEVIAEASGPLKARAQRLLADIG
jgi:pilus assembly protein FimV